MYNKLKLMQNCVISNVATSCERAGTNRETSTQRQSIRPWAFDLPVAKDHNFFFGGGGGWALVEGRTWKNSNHWYTELPRLLCHFYSLHIITNVVAARIIQRDG